MNLKGQKVVACGAGGFIGGHLVRTLLANGVSFSAAPYVSVKEELTA